jgi:hypothetical protein
MLRALESSILTKGKKLAGNLSFKTTAKPFIWNFRMNDVG